MREREEAWGRIRYSRYTLLAAYLAGCSTGCVLTMVIYLWLDHLT